MNTTYYRVQQSFYPAGRVWFKALAQRADDGTFFPVIQAFALPNECIGQHFFREWFKTEQEAEQRAMVLIYEMIMPSEDVA